MNKQVLITGASRGIGAALAQYFEGDEFGQYDVMTVSRSDSSTFSGDITDPAFRQTIIDTCQPDIVINNAGIIDSDWNKTFSTNYEAAADICIQFYNKMEGGHIINIGSMAANMAGYGMDAERVYYSTTKAALQDLSVRLAESGLRNTKVTSLELGAVKTTIKNRFARKKISEQEYIDQTMRTIPMKTTDIVDAVAWILRQPKHIIIPKLQMSNWIKNE